jgi:hypothetical protein
LKTHIEFIVQNEFISPLRYIRWEVGI